MRRSLTTYIIHIIPHLVALGAIVACLNLSSWQEERALVKMAVVQEWTEAPLVTVTDPEKLADIPNYTRVELTGVFDERRHVFLDNQTRLNHPGLHIYVPFMLSGSSAVVLINRGWQPWQRHLDWPSYPTPDGEIRIQGRLVPPPSVGFQLGEASPLDPQNWPNLMTYLDLARIQTVLGPELGDRIILLDPSSPYHLSNDPWPVVNMGPERHRAYAFQWLVMAVVIAFIWVGLSFRIYTRRRS